MAEGFVIMQIGNADLDRLYDEVIAAALRDAGLDPRRVDRHNQGDLLKSEIVGFIERAEIIVADLTNERPTCYLEVGYAMGVGKKKHLILTARADHFPGHPDYRQGGPRIHFDLQGYDILRWDPADFDGFRSALSQRFRRRRAILAPPANIEGTAGVLHPTVDTDWLDHNREGAHAGRKQVGLLGFWETIVTIQPRGNWSQQELRQAVASSTIDTFGWPLGISFNREGQRPRPTAGGVVAEVVMVPSQSYSSWTSYDYWNLQRSGDFYYFRSLVEDARGQTERLVMNTRIVQITEMLLFLARLYGHQLHLPDAAIVSIKMTRGGLAGRQLIETGGQWTRGLGASSEDEIVTELRTTVAELESRLVENVRALLMPVFSLFDFAEIPDAIWIDIIEKFVAGEVS